MLRATDDIIDLRHWAEARGARPCREPATGRLLLAFQGEARSGDDIGWDEFEPIFCHSHRVFVYDDRPGSRMHFIGEELDAQDFFARVAETGQSSASPEP
jgi:hypothetical protein